MNPSSANSVQAPFPWRFDGSGRTASPAWSDHVREMIEALVFTSPGERVNRPTLGSGLNQLVFAPNSPELAAALQFTLQAALQSVLGDVMEVRDLNVTAVDSALTVELRYALVGDDADRTDTFTSPA